MKQISVANEFQSACEDARIAGKTLGLVPTMGALHDGHRQLIGLAREQCDFVAVSIFVNPLQFDNPVDLEIYPRTIDSDLQLAEAMGVDLVFSPPEEEMHPEPVLFHLEVDGLSEVLEGASRPGHFGGVVTVVSKLFILAGRCRAYFGEKDFQQLAIMNRMVKEMHFPVEIVPVPIVRDERGLALSSRNQLLSEEQLASALGLSRSLFAGKSSIEGGESDPAVVEELMFKELSREIKGVAKSNLPVLDYALVVDPHTLSRPVRIERPVRLLIAARVGDVRLIDNVGA